MTTVRIIRSAALAGCSAGALLLGSGAAAQQPAIGTPSGAEASQAVPDEQTIIVTGSRIARSEGVAPASPVEILGSERLEATTTSNLATFLKDVPANFGSTFASGQGVGSNRGTGTVNLRGLGSAASLVLLNGQRTTQVPDSPDNVVDVNRLVPQIMIQRIEVVKDGASAIYGSDAVAGVVNLITKDRFEGLQLDARASHFTFSENGDWRVELLAGSGLGDRGHFVAAASYFDQDRMMLRDDIPSLAGEAYDARWSSPTSWPGIFSVPLRDAAGQLTSTRRNVADPLCGQIEGAFPSSGRLIDGIAERLPSAEGATQCRFHFYPEGSAQAAIKEFQSFVKFDYEVLDDVTFNATLGYTTSTVAAISTSGGTASPNIVVPGHNPGNVFRAVNANGQPLFAVSSGVSAGYSRDGAEVFLPARNQAGQVMLTDDPTNPASGIPFYEDVPFTGRPIGSQGGLPTGNTWRQPGFALSRPMVTDLDLFRASGGLSGRISDSWSWDTVVGYTRYKMGANVDVGGALRSQLINALQGLGGPNCTGNTPGRNGCEYYNLFGNNTFATTPGDPRANTQSVIDYVLPMQNDYFTSSLLTAEATAAGTLLELPAGDVGLAFGYQMRRAGLTIDYDINKNIRNTGSNTISYDFDETRTTHAFFGEAIVPVFDSDIGYLEVSGALRHERAPNQRTTDPKIGVLYNSPGRWMTVRGTYGTSFVAPSLFRLYAVAGGGGQVNDVCPNPVCTGTLNQVITSQTQGNLNLQPETAETWSVGAIVRPLPRLSLSIDWWRYDFRNRIATESPQQLLLADPDGSLTGRVIRGANGQVVQIITQYFNAASVVTEGFDIAASYGHDFGAWGNVSANLSATYVPTYRFQQTPDGPAVDYAGEENFGRTGAAAASPEWRGVLNLGWALGNHTLDAAVKYIGGYVFNAGGRISATLNPDYDVPSYTTVDLSYSYRLGGSLLPSALEEAKLSIGAVNLFANSIPELPVPASQSFLGTIYDIRGRMVWAGLSATF